MEGTEPFEVQDCRLLNQLMSSQWAYTVKGYLLLHDQTLHRAGLVVRVFDPESEVVAMTLSAIVRRHRTRSSGKHL